MPGLIANGCLPHLNQRLRRKHTEVSIANVQQRLLVNSIPVFL